MTKTAREIIQSTVDALNELAATEALETLIEETEWARSRALGEAYYAIKNFRLPQLPDMDYLDGEPSRAFSEGVKFAQECFLRKLVKMRNEPND